MQQFCWRLCFQQNIRNINPMNILNLHMQIITVLIRTTDLIHFAQIYRRYIPYALQLLEHDEKSLMMPYIIVLRHQFTLYMVQVVTKLYI